MSDITATLSKEGAQLLDGSVEAGIYTGRSDGIRNALRNYFESNPELTLEVVAELYRQEEVDLLTATQMVDMSPEKLREYIDGEVNQERKDE